MSFSQENGYIPPTFNQIVEIIRTNVNEINETDFTTENFVGTGWYKFSYAIMQLIQEGEIRTSEIFLKVQEYIRITNQRIQRPSVSYPGLVESFNDAGYHIAIKAPDVSDRGLIFIAVDVDPDDPDFPAQRNLICQLISRFVVGGVVSQGSHSANVTLTNGQSFTFRFNTPNEIPIKIQLTADVSQNNMLLVPDDQELRQVIFDNINARYRLGLNFEPQRYFTLSDAPWAGDVTLEWSDDNGMSWNEDVYQSPYIDLLTFSLEDIQVVIN